jgi:choline dehydrogenase
LALHIIDEYVPGRQFQSDEEPLPAARQCSETIYHPTSTCKMGHSEAAEMIGEDYLVYQDLMINTYTG